MRALAATLGLLLACYLPGRAAGRWCMLRTGRPLVAARLAPFFELVLGLCLASWAGLLLAEWGVFSAARLVALLVVAAALMALASGQASGVSPTGAAPVGRTLAAGGAIAAAVMLLYLPPYETIVTASDASVTTNAGLYLARHGTLAVPDGLLHQLDFAQRAALFQVDSTGRWLRLEGMALSGDGEHLWPSFSHLVPVWVAAFSGLGGFAARGLASVVFAALALWALFLFATEQRGALPAALAATLLLLNTAELFYGRFFMPEIVTQFFLWAGLLAFVVWRREGSIAAAGLSGLALGMAAVTRVEFLFLLPVPVALQVGLAATNPPGVGLFLVAFAAPILDGIARLGLAPSHYPGIVSSELARVEASSLLDLYTQALLRDAVLVVALGAIALAALRGPLGLRLRRAAVLAAAGIGGAAFVHRSDPHMTIPTLVWLAESVRWPVLVAGVVGLGFWVRAAVRSDSALTLPLLVLLIAGGAVLYDPHVGRNYLWGVRRLLPVVIPFACVLAATALADSSRWLPRRARPWILVGVAGALLAANASPALRLRALGLFPDQERPLSAVAETIPEGAIVFFTSSLTGSMVHVPLWLVHGRETAVLPPWLWKTGLRTAVPSLLPRRPVFLATEDGPPPVIEGLSLTPRGTVDFQFRTPDPDARRPPSAVIDSPVRLRVYELGVKNTADP